MLHFRSNPEFISESCNGWHLIVFYLGWYSVKFLKLNKSFYLDIFYLDSLVSENLRCAKFCAKLEAKMYKFIIQGFGAGVFGWSWSSHFGPAPAPP